MESLRSPRLGKKYTPLKENVWPRSLVFVGIGVAINALIGLLVAAMIFAAAFHMLVGPFNLNLSQIFSKSSGLIIAGNSATDEVAYVDSTLNDLIVTKNGSRIATISMGQEPTAVVLSADGNTAYVTCSDQFPGGVDTLNVVNIQLQSTVTAIPIGGNPVGLALSPDGHFAYVGNQGYFSKSSISVVDLVTNKVVNTIPVNNIANLAVSPDGLWLYALEQNASPTQGGIAQNGAVSIIDTRTFKTIKTISTGVEPIYLSLSPNGSNLAIGNYFDSTVTLINLSTFSSRTLSVPSGVTSVAFLPQGNNLLVSSGSTPNLSPLPKSHKSPDALSILNTANGKIVHQIVAPNSVVVVTVVGSFGYFIYGYQDGMGIISLQSYKLTSSGQMNIGEK